MSERGEMVITGTVSETIGVPSVKVSAAPRSEQIALAQPAFGQHGDRGAVVVVRRPGWSIAILTPVAKSGMPWTFGFS